ncbi:MAG TPA: right-handed parallel beta-helix repeat-containing protein [Silvibacterium sp.]|nr:right-handed parallel beta-helix repeat-containing protein [Silvibacterium sp.]
MNPSGSNGCFSKIQTAVNNASRNDVINVSAGTYKEFVTIGKQISLIGAAGAAPVIDATGLPHGIFVDGFHNAGLADVTIAGFTVRNALFEGILVVSASDVVIRNTSVLDNDKSQGLEFTGAATGCPGQPGDGVYENDETGDCGGAIHLIGVTNSILSDNTISGNADGVLISDETAESRDNLLIRNTVTDNPLECGIVLASHAPMGHVSPPFAKHFGVNRNTVTKNVSTGNGVEVGGSGVGLFSDGNGMGRVTSNVVVGNTLENNGLGGVAMHTHVGPAFGLPADDMSGNMIIGNVISGNGADQADTATPGTVGININSGGGGSPIFDTVIAHNVISDEQVDIAVNTPAAVDVHLNNLSGGKIGVADVCALDKAKICGGFIDATQNFWGCAAGPGRSGCTTLSGSDIKFNPWLVESVSSDEN